MRLRIFSPGCRSTVSFMPGCFSSKRLRSGSASCVFIAVYHTTSCAAARVIPDAAIAATIPDAASVRNMDLLDLREAHELVERMLAAHAAILESTEGRALVALVAVAVDPHVAGLDGVGHAQRRREVVGPDVGAQAELRVVHLAQHLGLIVPGEDSHDGAEDLLALDRHAVLHAVADGDVDEESPGEGFMPCMFASTNQPRAFFSSRVDVAHHAVVLFPGHH